MTPTPQTIGRTQPLEVAERLMREQNVRHLPVLDRGELVGIVSERDLHFIRSLRGIDVTQVPIEEAMTPEPFTVGPDSSLARVAREMADRKIGSAVVMQLGKVAGVFTTIDALRILAEMLEA
jgi:acetoin utilization protein AcuB